MYPWLESILCGQNFESEVLGSHPTNRSKYAYPTPIYLTTYECGRSITVVLMFILAWLCSSLLLDIFTFMSSLLHCFHVCVASQLLREGKLITFEPRHAICEQQRRLCHMRTKRRRSACGDQRLCCSLPRWFKFCSFYMQNLKPLASLCSWAGRFEF